MKRKQKSNRKSSKADGSISGLAAALGISRQAVSRHCKKSGSPPVSDVDAWREYLAAFGRSGSAPPDVRKKIAEQKLRLVTAMAAKAERENRKADGLTVEKGEVIQAIGKATSLMFSLIDRQANVELPPLLRGMDAPRIQSELLSAAEKVKEQFRQGLNGFGILKHSKDPAAAK